MIRFKLVDYLRFNVLDSNNCDQESCERLMSTAADLIESMQAENAQLKHDNEALNKSFLEALQGAKPIIEERDRLLWKLKSIHAHWNEFGPEHGFSETMDMNQP